MGIMNIIAPPPTQAQLDAARALRDGVRSVMLSDPDDSRFMLITFRVPCGEPLPAESHSGEEALDAMYAFAINVVAHAAASEPTA